MTVASIQITDLESDLQPLEIPSIRAKIIPL